MAAANNQSRLPVNQRLYINAIEQNSPGIYYNSESPMYIMFVFDDGNGNISRMPIPIDINSDYFYDGLLNSIYENYDLIIINFLNKSLELLDQPIPPNEYQTLAEEWLTVKNSIIARINASPESVAEISQRQQNVNNVTRRNGNQRRLAAGEAAEPIAAPAQINNNQSRLPINRRIYIEPNTGDGFNINLLSPFRIIFKIGEYGAFFDLRDTDIANQNNLAMLAFYGSEVLAALFNTRIATERPTEEQLQQFRQALPGIIGEIKRRLQSMQSYQDAIQLERELQEQQAQRYNQIRRALISGRNANSQPKDHSYAFQIQQVEGDTMANILADHPLYNDKKILPILNTKIPLVIDGYAMGCDMLHGYRRKNVEISINPSNMPRGSGKKTIEILQQSTDEEHYDKILEYLGNENDYNKITYIKITDGQGINVGGLSSEFASKLGNYIVEQFLKTVNEKEKCEMPTRRESASANNNPSQKGGAAAVPESASNGNNVNGNSVSGNSVNGNSVNRLRGNGNRGNRNRNREAEPRAAVSAPEPKKKIEVKDLSPKIFRLDSPDDPKFREQLPKILGYYAFVASKINESTRNRMSLDINFSLFTLMMLFNFFEQRSETKKSLSTLIKEIIEFGKANPTYFDIPEDEVIMLPISFINSTIQKERPDRFNAMDAEIAKFIGIFYALHELYFSKELKETLKRYASDDVYKSTIPHPFQELISLLSPFLFNSEEMGSFAMLDEPDKLKPILEKLEALELLSSNFMNFYKKAFGVDAFNLVVDSAGNPAIDNVSIAELGKCISMTEEITLENIITRLKYHNETIPGAPETKKLFEDFLKSIKDDTAKLVHLIRYITGSAALPNEIMIKMERHGSDYLNAHTCFNTLDIAVIGSTIPTPDNENIKITAVDLLAELNKITEMELGFTTMGGGQKHHKSRKSRKSNHKSSKNKNISKREYRHGKHKKTKHNTQHKTLKSKSIRM